jgi:hypothetical protein
VIVAVAAGIGWLYLLRDLHVPALGPNFNDALPLQQLAGDSAQPFSRMLLAWLPAGLALGVALGALTQAPRTARVAFTALAGGLLLWATTAVSDALALNERVSSHIASALSHGGFWLAVALLCTGVLIAPPSWARRPGAAAGASAI